MTPGKKPAPKNAAVVESKGREYYLALPDAELDAIWKKREKSGLLPSDEAILRSILRERKGFKPVEVHVSMCMRCNLPADNCACLNR